LSNHASLGGGGGTLWEINLTFGVSSGSSGLVKKTAVRKGGGVPRSTGYAVIIIHQKKNTTLTQRGPRKIKVPP